MRSAPRNCLSFVCVWTQKPGDNSESFLAAYREFFEAHKGQATVTIDHVQQKLPRDSCADPLWQVRCKLQLDSSLSLNQLESLSTDIARQWCTAGRSSFGLCSPLQWLQPDRRHGFWHGFFAVETNIKMRSISFGTFAGLNLFAERHCIGGQSTHDDYCVDCTFKHGERILQVFVELTHRSTCEVKQGKELYQLSMHYSNIFRVVVHDPVGGPTDVFLHLHTVPLFRRVPDIWECHSLNSSRWTRQTRRDRMNFQRTLQIGCACCSVLKSEDVGGCFVVKLGFSDSHEARRTVGRLSRKCKRPWFEFAPVSTHTVGRDADGLRQRLCERLEPQIGFACCYALNALLQKSDDIAMQLMLLMSEQFDAVLRDLESFAAQNESALEVTLFTIKTALENHSIVTFCTVLPTLFARICRTHVPSPVPRGSCLVRRVFVTPSHIFYMPPCYPCRKQSASQV
ncbi:hypothetical protein HPB48_016761 [Haemaphysalis longicornis]|uniref:Uncharacterized protein n=1 Tax=Haemaphysalis longicornis TaxID=44386 RepID=A0A9J6FVW7_HAELO|nr:hypothetical protein HPB48_016761 [Haemaphysalis longicornis]